MEKRITVSVLLMIALVLSGCSSISKAPPLVHNDRVGTVTVEHAEFKKDTRECSLEEKNKLQPDPSSNYTIPNGLKDVVGNNAISNMLIGYWGVKGTYDAIDRIGKCIEKRGWAVVNQ